jgi:hypothetical protein
MVGWESHITASRLATQMRDAATTRPMTEAEVWAQKVSFVWGQLPPTDPRTREEVERDLARIEGRTPESPRP